MGENAIKPVDQNQRTVIVDVLRGWALLGVAMMNYIDFATFQSSTDKINHSDTASTVTQFIMGTFFAAKSWTLLSVLFGYGFAVLLNNVEKKGFNPRGFFARRMFWLLVLACINSAFFFGDILKDYALMGFVMILFYRMRGKTALITSLSLVVVISFVMPLTGRLIPYDYQKAIDGLIPLQHSNSLLTVFTFNLKGTWLTQMIYPVYLIPIHLCLLACMLFGLAAYRYNMFNRLPQLKKQVKRTFWISLAVTLVLTAVDMLSWYGHLSYIKYFNFHMMRIFSTMVFIASSVCWLYIAGKLKRFFISLAYFGKMTLTNYMMQNVISMFVFSGVGLGLYNTMHPAFYVGLAIVVYILQMFFSKWWLTHYYYGPVEWVWRQLSYGKRLPIKKEKPQAAPVMQ